MINTPHRVPFLERESIIGNAFAGGYEVINPIAQATTANIYSTSPTSGEYPQGVAVKLYHPGIEEQFIIAESKILEELDGEEGCLPLLGEGEHYSSEYGLQPFIVTPLITGGRLSDRIERDAPPSAEELAETIDILTGVAKAARAAHERNIVLADIKPENILIQEGETGSLGVFGDTGHSVEMHPSAPLTVGSPGYMDPDVRLLPQNDTFSLGIVAYKSLSGGRHPFLTHDEEVLMARVMTGDQSYDHHFERIKNAPKPEPLSEINPAIPDNTAKLVMRCIATDPNMRPCDNEIIETFEQSRELALAA